MGIASDNRDQVKATLGLEHIGAGEADYLRFATSLLNREIRDGLGDVVVGSNPNRPWVAEITGRHPKFKLSRQFLPSNKDLSQANGAFSRGVRRWYILESGKLYEVNEMVSWKKRDRYFCAVTPDGEIRRVGGEEVEQWLNDH